MIKIACLLDKKSGIVADYFSDACHAVVIDAENEEIIKEISRGRASDAEFARLIAEENIEAVITGPIKKEPFVVLADEFYITRYDGTGLKAGEAVKLMNEYKLNMITDHIGGTGHQHGHDHHEH